jgi:hypothetical protein
VARIRSIKPEFWTDEKLTECSLSARLLFIGILNFSDDYGNLQRSAKKIKMQVFPADIIDCEPFILELINHGVLSEYSVNGEYFLHIKGFQKHQIVNRPSKSVIPPPQFSERSLSAHNGEERRGEEEKKEDKSYRFAGLVIRLNEKDYGELKTKYARIPDFDLELEAADKQYANDPKIQKNWFIVLNNRLNSKHQQFLLKPQVKAPETKKSNVTTL